MAGVLKIDRLSTRQIFELKNHTGVNGIYLTMSEQRFKFLLSALRFDDIINSEYRARFDKLAPIRQILDLFLKNFQKFIFKHKHDFR